MKIILTAALLFFAASIASAETYLCQGVTVLNPNTIKADVVIDSEGQRAYNVVIRAYGYEPYPLPQSEHFDAFDRLKAFVTKAERIQLWVEPEFGKDGDMPVAEIIGVFPIKQGKLAGFSDFISLSPLMKKHGLHYEITERKLYDEVPEPPAAR